MDESWGVKEWRRSGPVWGYLKLSGADWSCLPGPCEAVRSWGCLGLTGPGLSGVVWGCLGLFGALSFCLGFAHFFQFSLYVRTLEVFRRNLQKIVYTNFVYVFFLCLSVRSLTASVSAGHAPGL